MNIVVVGRNSFKVTAALRKYAEGKIGKFERYLSDITEAVVTLSSQKYRQTAEVLIKANGALIQAEGVTNEIYSAIDEVVQKLESQVKRHKDKYRSHRKSDAKSRQKAAPPAAPAEETGRIIKKKRSSMKPMTPEEAAMQMDVLGKNILIFTNDQTGNMNVLSRRKDGNFDLIEPAK